MLNRYEIYLSLIVTAITGRLTIGTATPVLSGEYEGNVRMTLKLETQAAILLMPAEIPQSLL